MNNRKGTTSEAQVHDLLDRVRELRAEGRWSLAAEQLGEAIRSDPTIELASAYLEHQHLAFAAHPPSTGPADWPPRPPDLFADVTSLPEVAADELTTELLSSALQHHGSLIVRGFMATHRLAPMIEMIDASFDAMAAWEADREADHSPWFVPFVPSADYSLGEWERLFVTYGGGVHAVDAPRAWFQMVDALRETGIRPILAEHFGEEPVLSAKKSTLRRAGPDSRTGWHQDGAFLGEHTRSVNIWTSLTDSGVDAPGLEVVHQRFDDILETGSEGAQFTWSVSPTLAQQEGGGRIECPAFEAGDALMFDERTLHQTAVDASVMTKTRYAIESWFFAPSTYPHEQIPIWF